MKTFEYTITDPVGLHARPAGLLVKESAKFISTITLSKGEKTTDAKRLFNLMGMGIKNGDTVIIGIEGEDEEEASVAMEHFMRDNI